MKMIPQEILSFLTNEGKRNDLIYKLTHAGDSSEQMKAFKNIITSFNLHKPPRGIQHTTLLQNTFRYCDPKECFTNFRLVCKSWQNAIETIRFDRCLVISKPVYCPKYYKMFKKVKIIFTNSVLQNWDSLYPIILKKHAKINSD
jgi:hypothetical protein